MKLIVFALSMFLFSGIAQAQKGKAKKPVKKTASKSKGKPKKGTKIKTNGEDEFDLFLCYEGGACTFSILKGDTLVYEVNQSGKSYQMFVIPNKFTANAIADFNWYTTAPDSKQGKVSINAVGLKTANKLITNLPVGDLKLTDASSAIWISEKSYKEITKGGTSIGLDGGNPEVFSSPEADASIVTITFKNRAIDLDGFLIQSTEATKSKKEISVLNISDNLLILKTELDNGSMVLKEVRANVSRK
jgi:hypothetical protein